MSTENPGSFRFKNLEIWKKGAFLSRHLFELADKLEKQRLFRFAEQLRAASLSITNNIAEGSGSTSQMDFANFLNISRRSVFEVANILMLLSTNEYLRSGETDHLLAELEQLSRMIHKFMCTLKRAGRGASPAPSSKLRAPSTKDDKLPEFH